MDEYFNYDSKNGIKRMPFVYHVTQGNVSIEHLRRALRVVFREHISLRLSLFFDSGTNRVMPRLIHTHKDETEPFAFVKSTIKSNGDLTRIMLEELFQVTDLILEDEYSFHILVFTEKTNYTNLLRTGDFVVFNFHPSLFDTPSLETFCQDLCEAYECETTFICDGNRRLSIGCK